MSIRHLIAYVLIAVVIAGVIFAIHQWRRAQRTRRYPSRIGSGRR